jgi:small conductance mechanosensitive channel
MEWKDKVIEWLIQNGPVYFWMVVRGGGIMLVGFVAARWLSKRVTNLLTHRSFEPPVRMLASRLVFLVALAFAAVVALANLGFEIMPLVTGMGVLGVGLGLATQGVLGNLVAGLTIIFTKPFRVGEYIDVIGEYGQVEKIELMATTLAHGDRSRVIIPNRKIVGEVMHNYGTIRQLDLKVGVSYDSNLSEVTAIVREVLKNNARVLKELTPGIGIASLDESCITISVKPWTAVTDYGLAGSEIYQAMVEKFRQRNINIPFPQREIHMLNGSAAEKPPRVTIQP